MKKVFTTKRMLRMLTMCFLFVFLIFGKTTSSQASSVGGTYPSITLKPARYCQIKNGCGVCSQAMIEGTFFESNLSKVYSNSSRSSVYNTMIAYNKNNKTYAYWKGYKYVKASSESAYLTALYNQLAEGYPVIVHRSNGEHYAVVYAYTGSKTSLQMSGFKVYNDAKASCKSMTLTKWFSGYTKTYNYIVRRAGMTANKLVKDITFAVNHPETYHKKGSNHAVLGRVVSNSKLTSVEIGVYKTDGTKMFSKSYTPNVYNFDVNKADSAMKFASLGKGSYYYRITAKDASGRYKRYQFNFKVVSSAVSSPSNNNPVITDLNLVKVTSVTLNANGLGMDTGDTFQLTATVLPSNASNKSLKWTSSDSSIVTVDSNGLCKTLSAGTAVVTAKAADGSGQYDICTFTVTGPTVYIPSFSTKNLIAPSGKYAKGKAMSLIGNIYSDAKLTYVKISAVNSSGSTALSVSASPNTLSYNIKNLDSAWTFRKLAAGSYTFKIEAKNEKMSASKVIYTSSFTITTGTASISAYTYPSGNLTYGKTFSCKGTVSASNKISKVEMGVKNATTGANAFSKSASPNAKSYDIHKLDSYMTFSKLAKGNYWYYVKVTESNGVQSYLVTSSFTVK